MQEAYKRASPAVLFRRRHWLEGIRPHQGNQSSRSNVPSGREALRERSVMKDQVTTLMEAVRQAQAVLADYLEPGPRNAEKTLGALLDIFEDKEVVRAMRLLYPQESPTLVPGDEKEEVAPPPPLSR